jgi:ribonuclease T1
MKRIGTVLIIVAALLFLLWQQRNDGSATNPAVETHPTQQTEPLLAPSPKSVDQSPTAALPNAKSYPDYLPPEALETIELIERGGPFPYRKDGSVFQNREARLPKHPRGYYREYTVETPGSRDRGARRIVTGGEPVETYCYTDDHYRSFDCFEVQP